MRTAGDAAESTQRAGVPFRQVSPQVQIGRTAAGVCVKRAARLRQIMVAFPG